MSKDPFQILADEITLARQEIQRLQRSSLNRDEAEDLNQIITKGQVDMLAVGKAVEAKIQHHIANAMAEIERKTIDAATAAAASAIQETRQESLKVVQELSVANGEARKQAWRYFGGFWVWLISIGTLGALVGALAHMAVQGYGNAREFGKYPGVYCNSANGEKGTTKNGRPYCAFWLDIPRG